VGGIPPLATFAEFTEYFAVFGPLEDALLPTKEEGEGAPGNCGFGFVTFRRSEDAIAVLNHPKNHTIRAKWVGLLGRRQNRAPSELDLSERQSSVLE
jgi:RNA recognition motif-containing protein